MGLPKKAKDGSKNKSKVGKEKDGKPKEPKKPQITIRVAQQVDLTYMLGACVDDTTRDMYSQQTSVVTLFPMLRQCLELFSCIVCLFFGLQKASTAQAA